MRFEDIGVGGFFVVFFVGIAILLYVIYCITKGETYFHPRGFPEGTTVTREENPFGFWMIVGIFLVFGLFCVILSGYYIVMS
jgi:hypothetical protein